MHTHTHKMTSYFTKDLSVGLLCEMPNWNVADLSTVQSFAFGERCLPEEWRHLGDRLHPQVIKGVNNNPRIFSTD